MLHQDRPLRQVQAGVQLGLDDCVRHSVTLFQNLAQHADPDANNAVSPPSPAPAWTAQARLGGPSLPVGMNGL
ncbi:Protein of unknown function, partial [Gryllus bimaculatus]